METGTTEGVLVFLIAVSVVFYTLLFREKKIIKTQVAPLPPVRPLTWKEQIMQELAVLEGPLHVESPKEAMSRFAILVDVYIRESFSIDPAPLTTPEILNLLAEKEVGRRVEEFRLLLTESDWVKFSRENRQEEHWQTLFKTFRGLLG